MSAKKSVEEFGKTPSPPRYVSIHRPRVLQEAKAGKHAKRTLGPATEEIPNPANYLKKHSKEPKLPKTITANPPKHSNAKDRLLAFLPHREMLARENLEIVKNREKSAGIPKMTITLPKMTLTTQNATEGPKKVTIRPEIMTAVPRKPEPKCVDTRKGHNYPLKDSGRVLQYTLKKGYGKAPGFVHQYKQMVIQRAEEQERKIKEEEAIMAQEYADAVNVLEDLEHQLEDLFVEHHNLPVVLDLRRNEIRKEKIEDTMDKVEKDIQRVKKFIADYYS